MPKLYIEKPSGYQVKIEDHLIGPMIYQPTTEGMVELAEKYRKKYKVEIKIIDERDWGAHEPVALKRIRRFKDKADIESFLKADKPVGVILMHGENHAIPILFSKEKEEKYMIIFDSSSGASIPGHYPLGNDFPNFQVMINLGTRQADSTSCITDAICILKDALRMNELGSYLLEYKSVTGNIDDSQTREAPRLFFATRKPENFIIFKMPEELLKSSQREDFILKSEADLDKLITKNNDTLAQKRNKSRITVSFNDKPKEETGINGYLHSKSKNHARYLDEILNKRTVNIKDLEQGTRF